MRWVATHWLNLPSQRQGLRLARWPLFFLLVCCHYSPISAANQTTSQVKQEQARLEVLRQSIGSLQQRLKQARGHQSSIEEQLRRSELSINKITGELTQTGKQLQQKTRQIADLRQQQSTLENTVQLHRRYLATLLRSSYISGRQDTIKLLLNQEDPAQLGRMISYHQYFSRARTRHINDINSHIQQLEQLQTQIAQTSRSLQKLQEQQQERRRALVQESKRRKQLLAQLSRQIRSDDQRLKRLQEDEKQLQDLVTELQSIIADVAPSMRNIEPFSSMKKKLPWPHRGKVQHRFGSSRKLGNMRWDGVLIKLNEGEQVRAIHAGRVAFSDWLRGFGMLLILDHGNGFMSLYGYNQQLLKQAGDWVSAGEILALGGSSGGRETAGLYFAIRHNGKPLNPGHWCSKAIRPESLVRRQ